MENNPGRDLRLLLDRLYPATPNTDFFVNKADSDFMEDGLLADLHHQSFLNYLVRRLLTVSYGLLRKYPIDQFGENRYQREIYKYLKGFSRLKEKDILRLKVKIFYCIETSQSNKPTKLETNKIKKRCENRSYFCYICGQEMDYSGGSVESNAFSVDHIWPRHLGGLSSNVNFGGACRDCNNKIKEDYIDFADFHYEHIAFSKTPYDFLAEDRKSRIEIAIFSKTEFCCSICMKPAYIIGELFIGKKEPNDGWHYQNLMPYCKSHKPKE